MVSFFTFILINASASRNRLTKPITNPYDTRSMISIPTVQANGSSHSAVQFHGRYCILNVDLTGRFCCDFEFSLATLQSQLVIIRSIAPVNFHSSPNYIITVRFHGRINNCH